ncbi:SRPBCC family protein [Kribbella sp. NPDC051587]|uniref:SRPBCC family protein n=1 Tax=Kribbella sp. NPDC051587 TaxID=3364119 RepID=UPI0037B293D4
MTAIVNQIEVDAPAAEVFGYVTDPTHFPEWQANVLGGSMDHETSVGAICSTTRRIGGRERQVTSEVTKYNPPTAWAVHGLDGPIRATVDVAVEPLTASQSRLTITLDFEGHGIGKVLVPLLVRPQSRKEMQHNMARLKARLEPVS